MQANDYQSEALRTAFGMTGDDMSQMQLNGVMGLCGEAGEVIDLLKKSRFQGHPLDSEKVLEELSDVGWYLAITAHAFGFTLDDVFEYNIRKLRKRYPEGFDAERSVNRNKYEGSGKYD